MSKRLQRGLTLVECCTTLTLISVLATGAMSSLKDLGERRRLDGHSANLATDLHYLRTEAVSRNQSLRISFASTAAGACYMLHTGDEQDCQCNTAGAATCQAGAELLKSAALPASDGVSLNTNVSSIAINPRLGTATPGGTLKLSDSQGREIRHIVAMTGRVRVCSVSPGTGLPRC